MPGLLEQLLGGMTAKECQALIRLEAGRQELQQERELARAWGACEEVQPTDPEPTDPFVERPYATGNDHRAPPVQVFAAYLFTNELSPMGPL